MVWKGLDEGQLESGNIIRNHNYMALLEPFMDVHALLDTVHESAVKYHVESI